MPRKRSLKKPRTKTAQKKARKRKPVMNVTVQTVKDYIFNNVPEKYCFVLKDGNYIRNLHELADAFHKMEDHVFSFHSNDLKNDFINWVWDVTKEGELALDLVGKDRKESAISVYKHIVKKIK